MLMTKQQEHENIQRQWTNFLGACLWLGVSLLIWVCTFIDFLNDKHIAALFTGTILGGLPMLAVRLFAYRIHRLKKQLRISREERERQAVQEAVNEHNATKAERQQDGY